MKPELFHLGGLTIYGYGFCILLGVIAAYLHFYINRKRIGISEDQISALILVCGIAVFVGGKLFFILEDPALYLRDPGKWLSNLGDGFVFYGSFLVTIVALHWWFKRNGFVFWRMMDEVGIAGAFVHGFGKIGCLMAGCCYGLECKPEDGIVFTDVLSRARPLNTPLYPVQLWDASIIFAAILFMYIWRKYKQYDGQIFIIYSVVYGIGRIITEEYRGDDARGFLWDGLLTHSQFIGILVVLFSLVFHFRTMSKRKNMESEKASDSNSPSEARGGNQ